MSAKFNYNRLSIDYSTPSALPVGKTSALLSIPVSSVVVSPVSLSDDFLAADFSEQFKYSQPKFSNPFPSDGSFSPSRVSGYFPHIYQDPATRSSGCRPPVAFNMFSGLDCSAVGDLSGLDSSAALANYHEEKACHFTFDQSKARLSNMRKRVGDGARWLVGDITGSGFSTDRSANSEYKKTHHAWFVTLTYRDDVQWASDHMAGYMNRMKDWAKTRGIKLRYIWVAEIQTKRRARDGHHGVHYHIVFWIPKKFTVPKADKRGWWPHGKTQTVLARSPIGYLLKYASKGCKDFPFLKGMRICGSGGFMSDTRLRMSFTFKPQYVRDYYQDYLSKPVRVKGGGWVSKSTGEFLDSLYECLSVNPLVIRLKAGYGGVKTKFKLVVNPFPLAVGHKFNFLRSCTFSAFNPF